MEKILYLIFSSILISCSTPESKELKLNRTISETFSASETKDLQTLFDFFNEQICDSENTDYDSLTACYERYCSQIKEQYQLKYTFDTKVDFNQQLEMYKQIDATTFKQIWRFGGILSHSNQKDTLKYMNLSSTKKYSKFLEKYGKENEAVKYFSDRLRDAGGITPTISASLIIGYERYDLSDIRTKLIIAIHYLTIND